MVLRQLPPGEGRTGAEQTHFRERGAGPSRPCNSMSPDGTSWCGVYYTAIAEKNTLGVCS